MHIKKLFYRCIFLPILVSILVACGSKSDQTPELDMALIPAGSFMMGSESGYKDESPVHELYLDAFYIDVYEVTNEWYAECVAQGACKPPEDYGSYTRESYYDDPKYATYPVIYVSWLDAHSYCEWRNDRLPTEAEWEKAARGELEGKLYPWGDELDDGERANFCDQNCTIDWADESYDDGYPDTAPVGSYNPNGYGLYDMAGNVWEWVADWYGENYYASSPSENPQGPSSGEYRVMRGGSWSYYPDSIRSAYREWDYPDVTLNYAGFRCASSP